jgi:hypothetical protein
MSASQRRKGTKGEQEVAREYRAQGFAAARVPNSGGLDTKGDVLGVPGVHVETKIGATIRLWEGLAQAELEAPHGQTPALHFRRSSRQASSGWYVAVPLDDWIDLLKARDA